MSFLLIETEDAAVVQDAFNLIDACDNGPIPAAIPEPAAPTILKRSRAESNRERDFRRRQRLKEEKLTLEMQSQQLQEQLQQLRDSGSTCRSSNSDIQSRVEAELLNRSLRKAVAAEIKWAKSLREVLDKRPTAETVSIDGSLLSLTSESVHVSPSAFKDDPSAIRKEIMATMDKMYFEAKKTIDPLTGAAATPPSLGSHYNVKLSQTAGPMTEMTSETPLNCSFEAAGEVLQTMFGQPQPVPEPHMAARITHARMTTEDGHIEKQFTVDLGGSRVKENLDGVGILRRHKEDDCEMVLWAAISFHQSGKISFRECSWMVAARAAPSATEESVIRLNYRLSAEKAKGCNYINGEHIDHVRNHALGAIGTRVKTKHTMLQRKMLVETGRHDLASFLA